MQEKSILVYGVSKWHPALRFIGESLAEEFKLLGYDVVYCDCNANDSFKSSMQLLNSGKIAFSVGLFALGLEWGSNRQMVYPYSQLDIPHVSVMLDMPYSKYAKGYSSKCKNHIVTVIDKTAVEYIKMMYPDKSENVLFLPLAGAANDSEFDIFSIDKKYDVVYISGIWSYGGNHEIIKRKWHEPGYDRYISLILDDVADYLECNADSVYTAFKYVLEARGLYGEEYLRKLTPYFWDMLFYTKVWRRIKGLELLVKNDIQVDVFGGGWEQVPFVNRLRLHEGVTYEDTLCIYAQSKILFQDAGEFNHGANDRTFNAMLNGAVLVTEYSKYLDDNFVNGQDLFMYDWQNGENQVKVIHELLADDCRRLAVAVNAYGKASRFHTWRNRAQTILEAVHLLYDRDR